MACWLPHTGFESAADHIDAVLEGIVADGWLQVRQLPDGKTLFYVRAKASDAARDPRKSRQRRAER